MRLQIERSEWRWVSIFAALVMFFTTIPYWIGWSRTGDQWTFDGFLYGIEDGHSYIGKMRLGARGELDFHLFYTPEAHQAESLIFLPYLLPGWFLGQLAAPSVPTLTPTLLGIFHFMRILFGMVMIAVIYAFTSAFLEKRTERRLATLLSVFGGGLGWLQIFTGFGLSETALPPEFYIPEGFSWLILLGIPHLALARAALLGGLLALVTAIHRPNWKHWAVLASVSWNIMALAVPFYLPIIYCIVGAWGLAAFIRDRKFPTSLFIRAVTACGFTLPLFIYYTYIFANNPAFAVWSAQNNLPSPPFLNYIFAYGLFAILAVAAARRFWSTADIRYRLIIGWLVIVPILVYLPINVQRRMSEAVIVPLALLAALTLTKSSRLIRVGLLTILSASSAVLLIFAVVNTLSATQPIYRPTAEIAAFNWLAEHAETDAVILSSVETGNALPAYTNLRMFMGHGPETLYWRDKTTQLERFYRLEMTLEDKLTLFNAPCHVDFPCSGTVRYLFLGPREVDLLRSAQGEAENHVQLPAADVWVEGLPLTLVYDERGYKIYEVFSISD